MIQEAISKLSKKQNLNYDEAKKVMEEMMDGTATQAQMGGFLMALAMQGETIEEITAFATVMREKGVKIRPERKSLISSEPEEIRLEPLTFPQPQHLLWRRAVSRLQNMVTAVYPAGAVRRMYWKSLAYRWHFRHSRMKKC